MNASKSNLETGLLDFEAIENMREGSAYDKPYFWTRLKLYTGETRVYKTSIPMWRLINTGLIVYSFVMGIYFIAALCTDAGRFISSIAMMCSIFFWTWATWWDEPYASPVTWTNLKKYGFHSLWIIVWLLYHTAVSVYIYICVFCHSSSFSACLATIR